MRLLMDTRFILFKLLTITSCLTVKVTSASGENEELSWTQLLRYKINLKQSCFNLLKNVFKGGEEKLTQCNKILEEMRVIMDEETNQDMFQTIKLVRLNLHDPELMILRVTRLK